jgi:hypothetical protein
MYSYYFDDDININSVNGLVEKLQAVEGKIELWFSTNGGQKDPMVYLISYLNSRREDITITLSNRICSAGTLLLSDFKGDIKIDEGLDFILFHAFDRESYSIRKDWEVLDSILTEQDLEGNKIFAKKLEKRGILTNKQIKQFFKGKSIVLYRKDFKNLHK